MPRESSSPLRACAPGVLPLSMPLFVMVHLRSELGSGSKKGLEEVRVRVAGFIVFLLAGVLTLSRVAEP